GTVRPSRTLSSAIASITALTTIGARPTEDFSRSLLAPPRLAAVGVGMETAAFGPQLVAEVGHLFKQRQNVRRGALAAELLEQVPDRHHHALRVAPVRIASERNVEPGVGARRDLRDRFAQRRCGNEDSGGVFAGLFLAATDCDQTAIPGKVGIVALGSIC